uniref:Potassium inwardly rectifying channel subfamily J member 16 n=1 Tax=Oryzias latipes TaxID=8090 RepID=A0A3P9MJ81_ORYLA
MPNQYISVSPADNITVKTENGPSLKKKRYIRKEGSCNITFRHIPEEWLLFVTDIFTTLVEIKWRIMFLMFTLSYILSWLFFGILFWVIAIAHGDVRDHHNDPCVYEVRSFTAAFLFSLETQTTIGYGFRGMSENCMSAIILVTVQDVISCFIDTFVIGVAVAKMASARKRAQTVGFSNCAVISLRNGYLCLSWRVGDFRRSHLVEGTASAQIVHFTVHTTGKIDVTHEDLVILHRDIVLVTPTTVLHQIEPGSPLYKMTLEDLRKADFELVVTFTYTDDTTGILHQTRTSYTPDEILWGHLFQEMIRAKRNHYRVDYNLFNQTAKVHLPMLSAEEFERKKQLQLSARKSPKSTTKASPRSECHRLKTPSVRVEVVDDDPETTVSTCQAGRKCLDTLSPPDGLPDEE